jgi:hypothetical protein
MSISTPQSGGSRRPSATKATAGGKPNLDKDESTPAKAAGTRAGTARSAGAGAAGAKATGAKSTTAKRTSAKPAGDTEASDATQARAAGTKSSGTKSSGTRAAGTKAAGAKAAGAKASGTKAAGAKATGSRPAARTTGTRPAAKAGGRRPIAPVKVSQGRNWGPILLFATAILIAVGIIGFAAWKVYDSQLTVSDRVDSIDGAKNFRTSDPNLVKAAQHQSGPITYAQNPPVAGKHNPDWQNCMGDVYDAPIASEHAVHSMEHGAVWVVYNPAKLDKAQIDALAKKVQGKEYSLMSPMENLDTAVSVQAWGFQLKTDNPADKRIDDFIKATRKTAGVEAAACSGGITETGTTPRDLQPVQQGG